MFLGLTADVLPVEDKVEQEPGTMGVIPARDLLASRKSLSVAKCPGVINSCER